MLAAPLPETGLPVQKIQLLRADLQDLTLASSHHRSGKSKKEPKWKTSGCRTECEMDRREFLRLAAFEFGNAHGYEFCTRGSRNKPGWPLVCCAGVSPPPGAVRPTPVGSARTSEREASQLASKLPEVSSPFNRAYLGWRGNRRILVALGQTAYWVDGATCGRGSRGPVPYGTGSYPH